MWSLTGLLRIFLRHESRIDDDPVALPPASTVAAVAATIHRSLAGTCRGARVWGPSARFEGQQVGREHQVQDGDVVEILGP
jgi:ribosome-interacting GTPase 1